MKRQLLTLGVVAVVWCVVGIASIATQGAAQQPAEKAYPPNWRYQMITQGPATLILLDTQTGRAWSRIGDNDWVDLKTPPSVKE